jgi:integrase
MASITNCSDGKTAIQFTAPDGKRKTIRLGAVPQRIADFIKFRIEALLSYIIAGCPPDAELARWIGSLDEVMLAKLSKVGLVSQNHVVTIKSFVESYIRSRTDTKESTRGIYKDTLKNLLSYFGDNKVLRDVTRGDTVDWRISLISKGLSENTVRRRCGVAKQFFRAAMNKDIIAKNPFDGIKVTVQANPSRMYFVTIDEAKKVIDACPDSQWRVIFALCRYGGMRCPSELLSLKWTDVNWEKGRITIHSPKTERYQGKDMRQIPIFPELLPYLLEAFDLVRDKSGYVITFCRKKNTNLRTCFKRIICKAHLKPWPKLFQNLRSSRETELTEKFPLHVVCAWLVAVPVRHASGR